MKLSNIKISKDKIRQSNDRIKKFGEAMCQTGIAAKDIVQNCKKLNSAFTKVKQMGIRTDYRIQAYNELSYAIICKMLLEYKGNASEVYENLRFSVPEGKEPNMIVYISVFMSELDVRCIRGNNSSNQHSMSNNIRYFFRTGIIDLRKYLESSGVQKITKV